MRNSLAIHPSYLSNIDLLVCGNSDPGTSGILSPYGNIDGLYFNDSHEPDDIMWQLKQDISKLMESEGFDYLQINCETKEDYYKMLDMLCEFNKDAIKIKGTSKKEFNIIVENAEDLDSESDEGEEGSQNAESGTTSS